jgi:hypothetical protein
LDEARADLAHLTTWSETLIRRVDIVLDWLELATGRLLVDKYPDFRDEVQVMRLHRMATRGYNGQALT